MLISSGQTFNEDFYFAGNYNSDGKLNSFCFSIFYENKIRKAYAVFLIKEKSNVKQLPFPGVLSAFIFPWEASTIDFT